MEVMYWSAMGAESIPEAMIQLFWSSDRVPTKNHRQPDMLMTTRVSSMNFRMSSYS